jgi:hypothetical protein
MPKIDLDSAATTLNTAINKTVSDTGLASTLNSAGQTLTALKDKVSAGASSAISSITNAIPGATSAIQDAISNVNKVGDLFKNAATSITTVSSGITGRVPNPLHYYSSYNYNFTLSVMDDAQINFPNDTYRKGILGPLILKSGSGNPTNRIPTANTTRSNPSGSFDYFIENLEINSTIGFDRTTSNTNATGFSFTIVEPYSMGIFFQTLQAAAIKAGHANYLDMPVLLTIEFKGHVDADLQSVQIDKTTKYLPLKFTLLTARVTGNGSEYDVNAIPINEKSFDNLYSQLKTDVSIVGKTIGEMLQTGEKSLQKVLNDRLAEAVRRGDVSVPDQILISFPKDLKTGEYIAPIVEDTSDPAGATTSPSSSNNQTASATGDFFSKLGLNTSSVNGTQVQEQSAINDIGASTMGFTLYNKADTPFAKDNLAYDEKTGTYKRGNITINPNVGEFKFAQGSDIVNAINQVILMSEYGRTALTQISSKGLIKWWRIEPHMYYIPTDANLDKTGQKPKLVVYRVVPYDVDSSYFLPPNAPRQGTEEATTEVVKEYNYIYTGKNIDVMDFEIEIKAGFFTALTADSGENNEGKVTRENTAGADDSKKEGKNEKPSGASPKPGVLPSSVNNSVVRTGTSGGGGGGNDDAASMAARQFHDAITAGVDLVNVNLSILGDPYYLGDSGIGNYTSVATDNRNINADGSMDYQRGPVHVLLNFRTPIDIDQSTGMYDFTSTAKVPQFSGLYQVTMAKSRFNGGKFTQELKMIRMRGQDIESTGPARTAVTPNETPSSEAIINEDGSVSNFRRNLETGELYDASGLYDSQGRRL